jgi:hypothetical protein
MSFCRWSDDDWKCDVYAYESSAGFELHVAARKYTGEIPVLPSIMTENPTAWLEAYTRQSDALKVSPLENIGLPYDGQSFTFDTLDELFSKLKELQSLGYRVPQFTFEILEAEIAESHQ